jgi:electron transport complex protein RnfD
MIATLAVLCTIGELRDATAFAGPIVEITSGGFLFAVFFIATDYVTSPASNAGKIVFGIGCSIVLFTIRSWGGFPEAIAFAVLFMNAFTPIIDRTIRPRVYGRDMWGKALTDIPDARRVL